MSHEEQVSLTPSLNHREKNEQSPQTRLSCRELFVIFLRAGLAFGGGLGILAALEEELVHKRRVVRREDFLTTYSMARLVPSGTMTAMAVAYGQRFCGWPGGVVAAFALVLPSALLTIALTGAFEAMKSGPILQLLSATLLPAALAFIVAATVKFGREAFRSWPTLLIASAAFVAAMPFDVHPSLILLLGGLMGLFIEGREKTKSEQ